MPIDFEVIERYRLEPPTEMEAHWQERIDAADYAIYRTKLELICEESKEVLVKMGVADMIQSGDCIVGLYTAQGDLAAAAVGTYLHAATGQVPIKYAIKHYANDPTVGVREGDIFFANEALYGGIHNPDMINVIPIMVDGEIIAWAGAASHEPETGAISPGGMPPGATTRWDEGLKVPPLKVGENFKLKTDIMTTITNNVRDERMIDYDMRARAAACLKIRQRLLELVEEKGVGFVMGLMRKLVTAASQGARAKIAQLNDGTFRHTGFFDVRGFHEGLGRLSVTLTKKGDSITIDLTGTSPQTQSYLNARPHILRATLCSLVAQYIFSDLPCSSGLLEPFEIIAPEGSVVNPSIEAALSGSVRLCPMILAGIHACLNKLMFDSPYREYVAVPLGAGSRNLAHGGKNQFGQIVIGNVPGSMNGAGSGARPWQDGVDAAGFYYSGWGDLLDVEHEELRTPFIYTFRNIPRDQGGFGKYRGGSGVCNGMLVHHAQGPWMALSMIMTARIPVDTGLFGGYAAGLGMTKEVKDSRWHEQMSEGDPDLPTNYHDFMTGDAVKGDAIISSMLRRPPFKHGEAWCLINPAAGGYGDPLERTVELIERDLQRGFLSVEAAERVYCASVDRDELTVDSERTEARRAAEREARKARGARLAEFLSGWRSRKPKAEIIRYFGPWPEAAPAKS